MNYLPFLNYISGFLEFRQTLKDKSILIYQRIHTKKIKIIDVMIGFTIFYTISFITSNLLVLLLVVVLIMGIKVYKV